ncbi:MAG TPA: hypothetical protein VFV73_40735 [Streptosporangiaceae bacterium]|nr:hypothetical protein [Streptosporangiaceae bacterium]
MVLLDRPGSAGQCSVAVDDRRGGEIAVSHLLELGHRRIVFKPELVARASSGSGETVSSVPA